MDQFLQRRRSDPRFHQGTTVPHHSSTAVGDWYRKTTEVKTDRFTFSAAGNYETSPKKSDTDKPKKKKRKSGEAFTESEKKKLENRSSSDDSDGGPCWVSTHFFVLLLHACVLIRVYAVRSPTTSGFLVRRLVRARPRLHTPMSCA